MLLVGPWCLRTLCSICWVCWMHWQSTRLTSPPTAEAANLAVHSHSSSKGGFLPHRAGPRGRLGECSRSMWQSRQGRSSGLVGSGLPAGSGIHHSKRSWQAQNQKQEHDVSDLAILSLEKPPVHMYPTGLSPPQSLLLNC